MTFRGTVNRSVLLQLISIFSFAMNIHDNLAVQSLGKYDVDVTKISVSGMSSGACMATQMHVAYSSIFMGAGIVAGSPYYCAQGNVDTANTICQTEPENIDVSQLITDTDNFATSSDIDPTTNLADDYVYIFAGYLDSVVVQGVGMKVQQFYMTYMNQNRIETEYNIAAGDTFPTVDYGNSCSDQNSPYMGRCSYYTAYEMLNHIYGNHLVRPDMTTMQNGSFYEFDQKEFFYFLPPSMSSMDDIGFVYVPSSGCLFNDTDCKLHVVFHGCSQGRTKIGDEFARNAGYNEVGELNNIIILYPQVIATDSNTLGCWDWWGYTVSFYATKSASQPSAVYRMVQQLAF